MENGKRETACTVKELLSQFSIFENGPDPDYIIVGAMVKMAGVAEGKVTNLKGH
jgi:hypothetical protein